MKRTHGPVVGDRKIARAHSATEVDKAIFDVVSMPQVVRLAGVDAAYSASPAEL